ncbi:hypothetical protein AKJ09_08441 [Labilithrix luteola]|uniref:Uncharacterized protein n=1 Tax=Labilithrix luteola TaxID=1391654 RepID=A0A0K1Q7R1_9BACT|nr:hypothetical protein [Labilithrix luteola]AKV01778.1 hypothetical protein AKJ09_08441 [Labilithrix luteola]
MRRDPGTRTVHRHESTRVEARIRPSWSVLTATIALAAGALSCSSDKTGTVTLSVGGEADALTRSPAPTVLVVEQIATDGSKKEVSRTNLPGSTELSLGDVGRSDTGALRVSGLDATGKVLVLGESLFLEFGALERVDMSVFVQRTGELARLPNAPVPLASPVVDTALGRYVLIASGTSTQLYDLLTLTTLGQAPTFARPARSLLVVGTTTIAIDENGASTLGLTDGTETTLNPPTGGSFAELAGGATIKAPDGSTYVVGGTRLSGGATARVLRVTSDGTASFASLATPREGACATWIEGRGLVVVGGSADGAGVEVLAATATQATPLAYPADPVRGCGASGIDTSRVIVAGGTGASGDSGQGAPSRVIDLACTANCTPAAGTVPIPLVRSDAVYIAGDAVLVAGDDASNTTHAFRVTPTDTREVPLRVARSGGRLVAMPTGGAGLVGGVAEIEQYRE